MKASEICLCQAPNHPILESARGSKLLPILLLYIMPAEYGLMNHTAYIHVSNLVQECRQSEECQYAKVHYCCRSHGSAQTGTWPVMKVAHAALTETWFSTACTARTRHSSPVLSSKCVYVLQGQHNRHVAGHGLNVRSSRSHTVFTLWVETIDAGESLQPFASHALKGMHQVTAGVPFICTSAIAWQDYK